MPRQARVLVKMELGDEMGWEIEGEISLMVVVHIYTLLYMNIHCKSIQGAMDLKE